jgi:hypothetical protein
MGRSKGNLGHRVPTYIGNPPNKEIYPEWWEDEENLMRLHPSYPQRKALIRRKYEQKKQQKKSK